MSDTYDTLRAAGLVPELRCYGCGNVISPEVVPWAGDGYVTHPNGRCAAPAKDRAASPVRALDPGLVVVLARLDILEDAIRSRNWSQVEWHYDRVRSAVEKAVAGGAPRGSAAREGATKRSSDPDRMVRLGDVVDVIWRAMPVQTKDNAFALISARLDALDVLREGDATRGDSSTP